MLLALAVHLAARPVRVDAVLLAIVALWTAMLAWAAFQRPSDSACALWADRHLGGVSAFSTLLEMRAGKQAVPNVPAMQWLEHWAAARVPHSLRLLGERHESARLTRPFLSALVCAALATIVLALPGTAPTAPRASATPSISGVADLRTPEAERPASAELVNALASALRSRDSQRASERRDDGRVPAAGPGSSGVGTEFRMAPPGTTSATERTNPGAAVPGSTGDAGSPAGAKQATGAGSGRDAGDGRDERADAGVSRVAQSTMQVQRRESSRPRPSLERQADVDQLAAFDDDPLRRTATAEEGPAPAAATPPPAVDAAPLTPTRAAYVQAWMNASRQPR
jgi:hypothetical protein